MMVLQADAKLHQAEAGERHQNKRYPQRMRQTQEDQCTSKHCAAIWIMRGSAATDLLTAIETADVTAPTPDAAVNQKRAAAPP
jgi:hypothetical protein